MRMTIKSIFCSLLVLLLISCNNQNTENETKFIQTDTIKSPINTPRDEAWTIERLNIECPYDFDTILKNGYNLHFERIKRSDEVNDIECQLTLVKGKYVIDTLNTMGYAPVMKNLGYIGADFNDYFAFVQSYGSGNPHEMQLLRKSDAKEIKSGYIVNAISDPELLVYANVEDRKLKIFDFEKMKDIDMSNISYDCFFWELSETLKIVKVTKKEVFIEYTSNENKVFKYKYYR